MSEAKGAESATPAARPTKRMADSAMTMSEIVGEESLQGARMQAGAILDVMDIVAGRVASSHCAGPCVTLSFDRVDLTQPILHADLIRLDARMASVGRSSMMVEVVVFRQDLLTREDILVQRSYVTMVAIDKDRRPNRNIPGLAIESQEERAVHERATKQKELSAAWQRMQDSAGKRHLEPDEVQEAYNAGKREFLTPDETIVTVRRVFLPRNTNILGTIFGGDILLWMDRVATYCARRFARNRNMVTLAMNRIVFEEPIFTTDLVEMTARVVYVRRYTIEVEIDVTLQRMDGRRLRSHSGYFTVLNYDEVGLKRPILTGLRLSAEDQDGLHRFQQAKNRYHFWKQHQGE
jgi:acyl-CoA thioesterase 11/acyl-coenzyme A thioesterase 9